MDKGVRTFKSGATRSAEEGKLDYEGFLSPAVLKRYAEFLEEHRALEDGVLRASDNWQRGMPRKVWIKSLERHYFDLWLLHRGFQGRSDAERACCGVIFNAMGYLNELLRKRKAYRPTAGRKRGK